MAADIDDLSIFVGRKLKQTTAVITYSLVTDNVTGGVTQPDGDENQCEEIDYDYSIAPAIICSMCFVFGIIYTFFGYRFFKAVMFLTGFIFGAVLVYLICLEEEVLPPEGNAGVALGAGFLCGLITMLVQYVGLFLTGFNFGVSVAAIILLVLEQFYHPETKWIPIGIVVGLGLVLALLNLKFQKTGTILGTSTFGGALMVTCLDFFIEQLRMMRYVLDRVKAESAVSLCWYSWIVLGCWPFCFIVGCIAQWRITGKGYDHREVLHSRKSRRVNLQKTRNRQRGDNQPNRYRHLYQVRRVDGDVISQSFIQNAQQKMSPSVRGQTTLQSETAQEFDSANTTLTQVP